MPTEVENPQVKLVCLRGTFCKGFGDLKRGDEFTVPENQKENGVPPKRWWLYHKKAATPDKAKAAIAELVALEEALKDRAVGN